MADPERKLAAILSADVVGYSRLMAEDEDETVRRLGAYRTEITNLVGEHRGRVVDFTGDNRPFRGCCTRCTRVFYPWGGRGSRGSGR